MVIHGERGKGYQFTHWDWREAHYQRVRMIAWPPKQVTLAL